ncbi:MAG: ABC transporter ATP-binding protein [Rhodobacteraceae bacterium]|nr:ABC transporter ATP-binding protein [Paracoccaceae bacterium]
MAAGAGPAALVALDGVEKRFGDLLALADFTLEAREGELVALLGPSGCGKSTVLRLIAGLARPGRGRIAWGPAATAAGPPGVVFQDPTLMPWATVEANVRLPLRLAGIARRDARPAVAEALASVGLSARADAYPRELSGGMRMRVSIARALVTRPALLLMDEPFAALDEITRFRLNDDLLAIRARRGATIVFVTHSVFEAVFLADRIVVMTPRPGRAFREIAVAAPHPRTAAFRQSPAFAARCREVSAALAAAMEGAGDDL